VVSVDLIRALRTQTGAGIMECKQALEQTQGDMDKAAESLRDRGFAQAAKRSDRETNQGVVQAYIHTGGRVGAIIELGCETDFVAKTDDFQDLAHNVAMQIAATNPVAVSPADVPSELIEKEKEIFIAQAKESGKPDNIIDKIVAGRVQKFYQEVCLVEQPYIKDPEKHVGDLITEAVNTLGENITIGRYIRYAIGESIISSNGQV